jgi:hypothetical protein
VNGAPPLPRPPALPHPARPAPLSAHPRSTIREWCLQLHDVRANILEVRGSFRSPHVLCEQICYIYRPDTTNLFFGEFVSLAGGRRKKNRVIHSVPDLGGFGVSFARNSFHPAARNETLFEAASLQAGLQGHCWVEQLHGDGSCNTRHPPRESFALNLATNLVCSVTAPRPHGATAPARGLKEVQLGASPRSAARGELGFQGGSGRGDPGAETSAERPRRPGGARSPGARTLSARRFEAV